MIPMQSRPPKKTKTKPTNPLLCFSEMQNVVMIISLPFIIYSAFELKAPFQKTKCCKQTFHMLIDNVERCLLETQ